MPFRFRKSFRIGKGIRLNLGKKGVSTSIGGKGMSVNIGKQGVRRTIGIPGTGISHTSEILSTPKTTRSPAVTGKTALIIAAIFALGFCACIAIGLLYQAFGT